MALAPYTTLLGALAGLGIGAADHGLDDDRVIGTTLQGGTMGAVAGTLAENLARVFRGMRLRKALVGIKGASQKDIKALAKAFRGLNVPIYQQTGGPAFDNACYAQNGTVPRGPWGEELEWRDVKTGKKADSSERRYGQPAVFVGKSFNKLPVIAHELGHADDFSKKNWLGRNAGVLMTLGSGLGILCAALGAQDAAHREEVTPLNATAMAMGIPSMLVPAWWSRRLERKASDKAIQVLSGYAPRKSESAKQLLQKAYATYDPIQIFGQPDFGSGAYA